MMRIMSWNVNGIRANLKKGFYDSVESINPDIICLQEIKAKQEDVDINYQDYYQYWNSTEKKGYSGTMILSKIKPLKVDYGINGEHNLEGRVITAEYDEFYLVTVYTPNAQNKLARLDYRLEWDRLFRKYVNELKNHKATIICGDLNVAHQEIDLARPKDNVKNAGFSPEERTSFTKLLDSGFIDTYRYLYPDERDKYTWWSYMRQARERNIGWRIDYFCLSKNNIDLLNEFTIHDDILGSDHCPISIDINIHSK